ncbi:cache domain-containing protein [Burkholderia sp. Bp8998]|uniref:cache domain-containing protein n=1 Tax=Burkholderia sp. Bp8998 TaxID=2184557 RepID=UPI000F599D2D|nr:cache domain-containing protein [Burkholderia sp. Bp8998]RQS05806.1 hypothetical protein DIE06_36430 [Burkholderia sp. Bp8998]
MATKISDLKDTFVGIAGQIGLVLDETFVQLEALAEGYREDLMPLLDASGAIGTTDLQHGKQRMVRALGSSHPIVSSMGVVIDVGVIEGLPHWVECIERDVEGAIYTTKNGVVPWRGAFYDYLNADWVSLPREGRRRVAVGPYVDLDRYLLTLACPIRINDRFIGVVAGDFLLDDFERMLAPLLSKAVVDCGVFNDEHRVLVSNSATFPVGELVSTTRLKRKRFPCGDVGWYVGTA